jgi:hypothetical protein
MLDEQNRLGLLRPYRSPTVQLGDYLDCARFGRRRVTGFTQARIPWPRSGHSLILCGDLIEAVRRESELAIAHAWGVSVVIVWRWRKALGIGRITPGTRRLYEEYYPHKITEAAREKMHSTWLLPELREAAGLRQRGKPAHPATLAGLRAAARRPKSEPHRAAISAALRRRGRIPLRPPGRAWTPEDEAILGRIADRKIAAILGCTLAQIRYARKRLGIRRPVPRPWSVVEDKVLETSPDCEAAVRLDRTEGACQARRRLLRIPSPAAARRLEPWTAEQERWLGRRPDAWIARRFGRSSHAVKARRRQLGIAGLRGAPKKRWGSGRKR